MKNKLKGYFNFSEYQLEVIGILLIIISIFIGISLFSYSPRDELLISRHFLIDNAMGIVGVFISYFFIKLGLGYFSWGFVPLIFLWGWWTFAKKDKTKLVRFTLYSLGILLLLSITFSMPYVYYLFNLPGDYSFGGFIGGVISTLLMDWLGVIPALIVVVVGLIILVFGFFGLSLYYPFELIFKKIFQRKDKKVKKPKKEKVKIQRELEVEESEKESDISRKSEDKIPKRDRQRNNEEKKSEKDEYIPEYKVTEKIDDDDVNYDDETKEKKKRRKYILPSVELLKVPHHSEKVDPQEMKENAELLTQTLADFGVTGKVINVVPGPVVTLYEVEPATGVRVNKISVLADDIARVMAAKRIRIIAPIPGKKVVGVEIPNRHPELVLLRSIVNSEKFINAEDILTVALGKTAKGDPFIFNLSKMPHLLIAGTTGSGKSVCINTLIMSILYRAKPEQVKFILVDPKKLELSIYKALEPYHLITSEDIDEYVVTNTKNAVLALRSAEVEMERRYSLLADATVRNISEYNKKMEKSEDGKILPYIVVIIDELADLMLIGSKEIEAPIARLAQMSRAVGVHLVVATQRPSVDVITGVIRSNFPARIGFQVPTKIDSRTILDTSGAEKLLGKGDMLFLSPGTSEPIRVHNAFITLEEIEDVLEHIKKQPSEKDEFILPTAKEKEDPEKISIDGDDDRDELFDEALKLVITHQQGSISLIQRRLKVGYSRAARMIDQLEAADIVGPFTGSKAREVLVGPDYLEQNYDYIDED
ncbi:MAG: DNA translocase FtsK 4TM domain-containing protein [Candidatus Marinimicrobia bacterium]|nr:DNA translocase FtsK 4TM domain-containing protein [Candidatus Neomarinimicrobiota bacterium]